MVSDDEHAKEAVSGFLIRQRSKWTLDAEAALWEIAKLRWWQRLRTKDIAEKALGIGKYWNKDFK